MAQKNSFKYFTGYNDNNVITMHKASTNDW